MSEPPRDRKTSAAFGYRNSLAYRCNAQSAAVRETLVAAYNFANAPRDSQWQVQTWKSNYARRASSCGGKGGERAHRRNSEEGPRESRTREAPVRSIRLQAPAIPSNVEGIEIDALSHPPAGPLSNIEVDALRHLPALRTAALSSPAGVGRVERHDLRRSDLHDADAGRRHEIVVLFDDQTVLPMVGRKFVQPFPA
jgi:hypothetical protein